MKNHTSLTRDLAAWIATTIMTTGHVPTRTTLEARYGLSRATSYRWHEWALDYFRALNAGRIRGQS
jgi:hypothetical protein